MLPLSVAFRVKWDKICTVLLPVYFGSDWGDRGTSFYIVANFDCSYGSQWRSLNKKGIEMGG